MNTIRSPLTSSTNRPRKSDPQPARHFRWSALLLLPMALAMFPAHAEAPSNVPGTHSAKHKDAAPNTTTLNFVDADIESVIAAVGDYTNTTFIIDPRVKGTITLVSEKPLTKAQAFQLLTSVLRLRGYTVVTGNGYTKVVPEGTY